MKKLEDKRTLVYLILNIYTYIYLDFSQTMTGIQYMAGTSIFEIIYEKLLEAKL